MSNFYMSVRRCLVANDIDIFREAVVNGERNLDF
jgi:hypothetical protein